ncbi:nucleotidyltransferase domain-containing protein [Marispirochaeta aestuarii]|uniref:nucleotidyltransferase family protein n=1 Tax=Marispirochaeta aestuarii TaxID=1963862 RepID=UPI0029C671E4|nr:nucleotidyltransferase domain-containing protein [Marispirochaeta aestuarii]
MAGMGIESLPKDILDDIELAKSIILDAGAEEIYLFGSIATGVYTEESDLDIAIIGLEKKKFFQVYGELLSCLKRSVDIVGLDYHTDFSAQIKKESNFIRVA